MSQPTIKFDHEYPKLWGQKKAKLLAVDLKHRKDLSNDLVEYDTSHKIDLASALLPPSWRGKGVTLNLNSSHHKPPDGLLIHLTFLGDKGIPFCTLRSYQCQKFIHYQGMIGREFILERKGK